MNLWAVLLWFTVLYSEVVNLRFFLLIAHDGGARDALG